jgi:hypothetical protein
VTQTALHATCGAIVAALRTAPAIAPQVDRVRLKPWPTSVSNSVVVRPAEATRTPVPFSPADHSVWQLRISVDCYGRANRGANTTAEDAADAQLQAAYSRLMADPSLGGALLGLEPVGVSYDFDEAGDPPTACASLVLIARCQAAPSFT